MSKQERSRQEKEVAITRNILKIVAMYQVRMWWLYIEIFRTMKGIKHRLQEARVQKLELDKAILIQHRVRKLLEATKYREN